MSVYFKNKTAYVKLERIVLDQLDHPGIVRLFFTFQDTFSEMRGCHPRGGGELGGRINLKIFSFLKLYSLCLMIVTINHVKHK